MNTESITIGLASLLAVLLTAMGISWLEMELSIGGASEVVLAVPAVWAILSMALLSWLVARCTGVRLLTPQHLLIAACAASLSAPLLTQGFWHRMFGAITTFPREGQLVPLSSMSDKLWPHGPDLAAGWLTTATPVTEATPLRLTMRDLVAGEPVLATALVQAESLPNGSTLTFTLVASDGVAGDGAAAKRSVLASIARPTRADALRQDGYESIGSYGVPTPPHGGEVILELALSGPGTMHVKQPTLRSVAAIETALRGARSADQDLLAAHRVVPWSAWRDPLLAWGGFLGLLFTATYAVNAVMRRQWVDAERFSLPIARTWSLLLGATDPGTVPDRSIWRSGWVWGAAGGAFVWGLLRWAHAVNPGVPDLGLAIQLSDYLRDPGWGGMWDITFSMSAMILGIALFFEVGLLGSLLVGFLLFRYMLCLGERTGINSDPSYPWRFEQQVGSFVAYGLIIVCGARRHLVQLAGKVFSAGWRAEDGEALSARLAAVLLMLTAGGTVGWAMWTGVGVLGTAVLMGFLLLVGIVAARLRAEAGLLFSLFAPYSAGTVLLALGGIGAFGADVVLLAFIASFFLAANTFFIPGAQLELIEQARRMRQGPGLTAVVAFLGIAGGLLIGGWIFLTTIYGVGADQLPYQWAFDTKPWYFGRYQSAVAVANAGEAGQVSWAGYLVGLIATGAVAGIRLIWTGFAFHPAGVLFGPSYMLEMFWGSVLVAFALRWSVVRAGGAAVVRTRLLPVAIGLIIGSATAYIVVAVHTAILLRAGSVAPSLGNSIL